MLIGDEPPAETNRTRIIFPAYMRGALRLQTDEIIIEGEVRGVMGLTEHSVHHRADSYEKINITYCIYLKNPAMVRFTDDRDAPRLRFHRTLMKGSVDIDDGIQRAVILVNVDIGKDTVVDAMPVSRSRHDAAVAEKHVRNQPSVCAICNTDRLEIGSGFIHNMDRSR